MSDLIVVLIVAIAVFLGTQYDGKVELCKTDKQCEVYQWKKINI